MAWQIFYMRADARHEISWRSQLMNAMADFLYGRLYLPIVLVDKSEKYIYTNHIIRERV
jgi:hypothetical protein